MVFEDRESIHDGFEVISDLHHLSHKSFIILWAMYRTGRSVAVLAVLCARRLAYQKFACLFKFKYLQLN